MSVPCVRVAPEDGERVRQDLAAAELVDDTHEIEHADGWLYIPVADPSAVSDEFEVVDHDAPTRETQTMPADLVDFDPSYARVGDVAVVDEDDAERARALADAIVDSALPVQAVLNRASKIKGDLRVRDWEVLAGEENATKTVHREYGCEYAVDLAAVYFSPRLATERHRVVEQVQKGEHAFDMFAGVGPFVVPFAERGAEAVGVDLNGTAVEYLRENARRNGVANRVTAIEGDVRDVVSDPAGTHRAEGAGDVANEYTDWADRVVMNLPHSADGFLDTAVALAGDEAVVHYYDIQHEDELYGPGERAIRAAAEPEYEVSVETCHTVRSYAPHERNTVLDVRLTR